MKSMILQVQTHTIQILLEQIGIRGSDLGIHVVSIDVKEVKPPILYPFRSDHFSFLFVTEGELQVNVNLLEYTLKKCNVLLLSPQVVRQFVKFSSDCKTTTILFTSEYLLSAGIQNRNINALEFLSSHVNPLLNTRDKEWEVLLQILDLLETKMNYSNGQAFQEEVLLHVFAGFIYEIGSLYKKQESIEEVRGTRKEELTFRFLKLLPLHYKDERSVLGYASIMNITAQYLSQAIKEVTGKTASDFIGKMVLMEAKILLTNRDLTIAQVAAYLNFSDQFFFSKYFKKQCGISPSNYRKTAL
jgi:AraC family transcriptional regulator, transcriptional activator of pobA